MTDLQMGLIGLGIAAVAGVMAYNKWQEARQREQVREMLKPPVEDVLKPPSHDEAADARLRKIPPAPPAEETWMPPANERIEPVWNAEPESFSPEASEAEPPIQTFAQAWESSGARESAAQPAATIEEDRRFL